MKKKVGSILMVMVMCASAMFTFAACSKSNELKVAIYLGGYGQLWMGKLAEKFEQETGIKVTVEASPSLPSDIPNRLMNGSNDDIFFCHGVAWEQEAVSGRLENLNDLYAMEVSEGVTFSDRIIDDLEATSKMKGNYYKVPWTNGAGGLIYNKVIFDANGWGVPTVYSNPDCINLSNKLVPGQEVGLLELCKVISKAGVRVDPDDNKPNAKKVVPFAWSEETYYWDYVVYDWWAQMAGIEKMNTYAKAETADVFNPETYPEQKQALKLWKELVADNPGYSIEDPTGKQYTAAQMDFVNGMAAMIPCAQWLDMQMVGNYDTDKCKMVLMPTPVAPNAKLDANGKPIRVNYTVGGGENILIPAAAPHKETAKKFLAFLVREDNAKLFLEKTNGCMLATDYSNTVIDENSSDFTKSVFEINTNSKKFNLWSSAKPVLNNKVNLEWPVSGVQHYAALFSKTVTDIDAIYNNSYAAILKDWPTWNS